VSKSRRALQEIVGVLSDQLARGWASLEAARQIDAACEGERPGVLRQSAPCSAHAFWTTTYDACVESALLAFARLAIAHKDSISVSYLLNCVQQSPSAFPVAEREAVMEGVAAHRALVAEIEPLVAQVREYRDRTIAHLDKKHVNHYYVMRSRPPVDLGEIDRALVLLFDVLNAYRGVLGLRELELDPFAEPPQGLLSAAP
jgi:hypothetical protein